jgi:hypothetical protein
VHRKNILIYIQQDATLRCLFYLETALHVSGGNTTHDQERKQLFLEHLVFVRRLLLPAATAGYPVSKCRLHGASYSDYTEENFVLKHTVIHSIVHVKTAR